MVYGASRINDPRGRSVHRHLGSHQAAVAQRLIHSGLAGYDTTRVSITLTGSTVHRRLLVSQCA
jgi:hypothetical protein